eukprot:gene14485-biopygen576
MARALAPPPLILWCDRCARCSALSPTSRPSFRMCAQLFLPGTSFDSGGDVMHHRTSRASLPPLPPADSLLRAAIQGVWRMKGSKGGGWNSPVPSHRVNGTSPRGLLPATALPPWLCL